MFKTANKQLRHRFCGIWDNFVFQKLERKRNIVLELTAVLKYSWVTVIIGSCGITTAQSANDMGVRATGNTELIS